MTVHPSDAPDLSGCSAWRLHCYFSTVRFMAKKTFSVWIQILQIHESNLVFYRSLSPLLLTIPAFFTAFGGLGWRCGIYRRLRASTPVLCFDAPFRFRWIAPLSIRRLHCLNRFIYSRIKLVWRDPPLITWSRAKRIAAEFFQLVGGFL